LIAAVSLAVAAPLSVRENALPHRVTILEEQVASLTQRVAALTQPMIVDVDCAAGQRIQAALARVQNHPAPVQIKVFGVCPENLLVRSPIHISAGAPGAGITAANPTREVIRSVPGPRHGSVLLEGLIISGGSTGVFTGFGAHVRLVDCVVRHNATGILAEHQAIVQLQNTVVENNTSTGVSATTASHVLMSGGVIQNNAVDGLALRTGASASVGDSATIASSGRYGISVDNDSVLSLNAATVTASTLTGIFVSGGSTIELEKGATITANLGSGISLMDTSLVHKRRGEADVHITNNGAFGVVCSQPPAVSQIVGFTFQTGDISGNGQGDINCPISPGPLAQ
jgi:hypothetical protein